MQRIKYLLLCASLFFFAVAKGQKNESVSDKRLVFLDTAFERAMNTWNTPGFAVAVVEKNKIIYARGFGFRDRDKKLHVTPNTIFAIGSCTKAFTTSLIGILQKEGKLDIDKPAHEYLPDLNFYSQDLTSNVTLRDMMSHRTGLPRHDYSWYLFPTSSRDSMFRRIQFLEPTFPLRRMWQYNNFMFVALGALAEKTTGKSWEDNIREKILMPLHMKSTEFSILDMGKNEDAASGYGLKKDSLVYHMPYYEINAAGPAGSINSNVIDMANWMTTWINGGKFDGKEVIPADFLKEAMSSQTVISPAFPSDEKPDIYFSNYGLGWFLSSYKGHYRVEHGGNIDGFSASTCFFPTDSIGIIVLTNQDGSFMPSIVRNLIADKLLHFPYFDWNGDQRRGYEKLKKTVAAAQKVKSSTQILNTSLSHPIKDYEGLYSHPGYGTFEIFMRHDSLLAQTPNRIIWLKHYHYDIFMPYVLNDARFDPSDNNDFRIQFNTGINGDIESLNTIGFESPAIALNFKKTVSSKSLHPSEIEKYAGVFEIAGTEIKFYMKSGHLAMFVPNQPEYELIPTGNDQFSVNKLSGFSVQFLKGIDGLVNAVNLIQPNGTFRAEKKK